MLTAVIQASEIKRALQATLAGFPINVFSTHHLFNLIDKNTGNIMSLGYTRFEGVAYQWAKAGQSYDLAGVSQIVPWIRKD